MYRQCDMQQGDTVVRGYIRENTAAEGVDVKIGGLDGLWNITRVYGFSTEDHGLKQIHSSFVRHVS